ncbi:PEP-utilizing enzyme [Streptomyces sp. WMMC500]|uniref:PEP/pyruvate-binding domain-containing protein n=1 Tax=Streptomyces sp. WMMC500 TaxID=3015154 RepID=UPI00248BED13|nr:PEP/pyruvate-binding domain-containing protein [Streptomyces sp. WMMC500]WBB60680.1 PEP-utilizing enzyme [Streptomyces sp. WMMC500]
MATEAERTAGADDSDRAARGARADRLARAGWPAVLPLHTGPARDPDRAGAKAANLARAAAAGLPVLPGFVLTDPALAPGVPAGPRALRAAWRDLSEAGQRPLIVRSSSAYEDAADSSMAGWYETVPDVRGWEDFAAAVRRVLDSAARGLVGPAAAPREAPLRAGAHARMAVLVQPMLRPAAGGVMFGADPVAGRHDRLLVSAVDGGPDTLVDGTAQGIRYQLNRRGRRVAVDPAEPPGEGLLGRGELARLASLARRAERVFGGPQDVEFGFDPDGRLWLFQSRPITAMPPRPPRTARLLGPGPVAETFPAVLQPLEEDLWVAPMAHGLAVALDIAGTAPRRHLRALPVVTTVDGRAAADLRLLGAAKPAHPVRDFLNPLRGARLLGAAWRMGRLRTALPALALDLMAEVDEQLAAVPGPAAAGGRLLDAAGWGRTVLSALHAQESLAGALPGAGAGATAAGEALAVLAEEGRDGAYDDAELIARHPVLLALLPPALGAAPVLPARTRWSGVPRGVGALPVREGLRLRIRWVQEMQSRVVAELAERLVAAGALDEAARVALLRWPELVAVAEGRGLPRDFAERLPRPERLVLPAAFRLAGGRPVAEPGRTAGAAGAAGGGQGAGGGAGAGVAWDGTGERPPNAVLVVPVLDPGLAPQLAGLAGLVAETGSALSHLAVLAREFGVPTAVGVPGAVGRFPPGTALTVDGTTGAVTAAGGEARTGDGARGDSREAAA